MSTLDVFLHQSPSFSETGSSTELTVYWLARQDGQQAPGTLISASSAMGLQADTNSFLYGCWILDLRSLLHTSVLRKMKAEQG